MFAHRGVHRNDSDENTMDAFRMALRRMDGFECDVRLSRDGIPVVVHDHTLLRTHNIESRVQDLSASELYALNVPLVHDVVDLLWCRPNRGKRVVFDIKVSEPYCIKAIVSLFAVRRANVGRVIFLVRSKLLQPSNVPFTILRAVDTVFRDHVHVDGVACKYDGSDENTRCIKAALARGIIVNLYTSDVSLIESMRASYDSVGPLCTLTVLATPLAAHRRKT